MKLLTHVVVTVLLVGMTMASLPAGGSSVAEAAAAPPIEAAASLAATIVESPDLEAVVAATQEALSWGGVTVADPSTVYLKAKGPRAAMQATPLEVLNLALEARDRETAGRISLDELADRLDDFRFPFPRGTDPGKKMVKLLKVWIAEAKKLPNDPRSFTPLFLNNMALRQSPSLNLAAGGYPPETLRLTLLEAELLTAAFMRVKVDGAFPARAAYSSARGQVSKPCSDFKDGFNKSLPLGGDILGADVNWLGGQALEKGVEKMTGSALKGKLAGKVVSGANIALRIIKVMAIYGTATVRIYFLDPADGAILSEVHKPMEQLNVDSDRSVAPTAVAGLSDKDWEEYKREVDRLGTESEELSQSVKDCFGFIGMPAPTDLADLADEMNKWRIEWTIGSGTQFHARINVTESKFDFPGQMAHYLKKVSDHEGGAVMRMDVLPEREEDHPGVLYAVNVIATAELDVSQPPSFQTFVDAAMGPMGLASSLVEAGAGMLQSIAGPTASTPLEVNYHVAQCTGGSSKPARLVSAKPSAEGSWRARITGDAGCGVVGTIEWGSTQTASEPTLTANYKSDGTVNIKMAPAPDDPSTEGYDESLYWLVDAGSSYSFQGSGSEHGTDGANCEQFGTASDSGSGTFDGEENRIRVEGHGTQFVSIDVRYTYQYKRHNEYYCYGDFVFETDADYLQEVDLGVTAETTNTQEPYTSYEYHESYNGSNYSSYLNAVLSVN